MSPVPLCLEKWGVMTPQLLWERRPCISAGTRNFTSGKSDVYVLAAAATRAFTVVFIGVNFYKAARLEPPTFQTPRLSGF